MHKHYLSDHPQYPRPTLFREGYIMLDGTWQLVLDPLNEGLAKGFQQGLPTSQPIQVFFAYQTKMSGVHLETTIPVVWYGKTISLQGKTQTYRLHFEGVDDGCEVWWNGYSLGRHEGGYVRFSFTIHPWMIQKENQLILRVEDDFATDKPRGKQRWQKENFGCWYVETSGIYKSVWLEPVGTQYITQVLLTPNIQNLSLSMRVQVATFQNPLTLAYEVTFQGEFIAKGEQVLFHHETELKVSMHSKSAQFRLHYWTPEQPNLYEIRLTLIQDGQVIDQVKSYVGMRDIQTKGRLILLNHEPIYLKMILDQGYWPDSGLTPPSIDALLTDIKLIKAAGFNGVRKHQKIEDERFYYLCDLLGLLVWLELPSAYEFNHTMQRKFNELTPQVIHQYWNYTSIMTYVIMNESWGVPHILTDVSQQQFVNSLYDLIKSFQTGRLVIGNDGWEHVKTDLITIHNYVSDGQGMRHRYQDLQSVTNDQSTIAQGYPRTLFAQGFKDEGQPYVMSEYGGVALQQDQGWGYGEKVNTVDAMMTRLKTLTKAIAELPHMAGYCLTQLTDVEQEVNGIFTPKREPKAPIEILKTIHEQK